MVRIKKAFWYIIQCNDAPIAGPNTSLVNNSYSLHGIPQKKTSKNGIKDAQISDIFAASNFYASWSGFGERVPDCAIAIVNWQQFLEFLLQRMIDKTVRLPQIHT